MLNTNNLELLREWLNFMRIVLQDRSSCLLEHILLRSGIGLLEHLVYKVWIVIGDGPS